MPPTHASRVPYPCVCPPEKAVQGRRGAYRRWQDHTLDQVLQRQQWIDQHLSRTHEQGRDYGIEL